MKRIFWVLGLVVMIVPVISGCAGRERISLPTVDDYRITAPAAERRALRVGFVPGPYGDMFMEAIYPFLREKGYDVALITYEDYSLPNHALARNQIDLNLFQHYRFLVDFKFENDMGLSAIAETPTVPMGIYSTRYTSLAELEALDRIIVSVPEDVTNYARALLVLEDAGLIRLDRSVDRSKVTSHDIVYNPHNLRTVPLRPQNQVQSLQLCDISVINGNFAVSGGLSLSNALFAEWLSSDYFNIIAVRTEDLGAQFVKDIIGILHSDAFRGVITDPERGFHEYQRPFNFNSNFDF